MKKIFIFQHYIYMTIPSASDRRGAFLIKKSGRMYLQCWQTPSYTGNAVLKWKGASEKKTV